MPIKKRFQPTLKDILDDAWKAPLNHASTLALWDNDGKRLTQAKPTDFLAEMISDVYGEPCEDTEPNCDTCNIWKDYWKLRGLKDDGTPRIKVRRKPKRPKRRSVAFV